MIAVLDYGIGNLASVEKALQHVGADARLVSDPEEAASAAGVVLPGVGAFGACARALREARLGEAVEAAVGRGVPFLGICVGFQLMFEGSEEDPGVDGLGLAEGVVRSLSQSERLPQMQWNVVAPVEGGTTRLLDFSGQLPWFYFVHSFAPVPEGSSVAGVVGTCEYGGEVVAAFEDGNVFGTQFHPEKSARAGLDLLARFARLCGD